MNVFYIIIILNNNNIIYISSASGLFLATHTNPKCFLLMLTIILRISHPEDWINQPSTDQLRKNPGSAVKKKHGYRNIFRFPFSS